MPLASLFALNILADALQLKNVGDVIMTTLISVYGHTTIDSKDKNGFKSYWTPDMPAGIVGPATGVNLAYQKLPHTSDFRRLLVHLFADSTYDFDSHCAQEPPPHPAFVVAVGKLFATRWVEDLDPSTGSMAIKYANTLIIRAFDHCIFGQRALLDLELMCVVMRVDAFILDELGVIEQTTIRKHGADKYLAMDV